MFRWVGAGAESLRSRGSEGLDFWEKVSSYAGGGRWLGRHKMGSWGLDSWVRECLVPLGGPGAATWLERLHFPPWTRPRRVEAGSRPFPHPHPQSSPPPRRGSHRPGSRRRAARAEAAAIVAATAAVAAGPGGGPDREWRGLGAPCLGSHALTSPALPPSPARPQR